MVTQLQAFDAVMEIRIGALWLRFLYLGGPKWPKMRQKVFFFVKNLYIPIFYCTFARFFDTRGAIWF